MKKSQIIPFSLRIPPEMKDQLEAEAEKHQRTMTAEILRRLEDSLAREERADYATGAEDRPSRDEVLNLLLHGMTAGLDAFEQARDAGASSADMHRAMKTAILEAFKEKD